MILYRYKLELITSIFIHLCFEPEESDFHLVYWNLFINFHKRNLLLNQTSKANDLSIALADKRNEHCLHYKDSKLSDKINKHVSPVYIHVRIADNCLKCTTIV